MHMSLFHRNPLRCHVIITENVKFGKKIDQKQQTRARRLSPGERSKNRTEFENCEAVMHSK